jgi:hypothetical protein
MNCSEFDAFSRTSPVFANGLGGMGTNACGLLTQLRSHCAQPVVLRRDHLWTVAAPPIDVIRHWGLTFTIMPPWGLESVDLQQMLSAEVHSHRLFRCLFLFSFFFF